jgi:putative heme-binding domain-containing protein
MRRQTKEMIAFHIANPDAEIAPAYTAYTVSLRSGSALTGLVTGETGGSITVRMPGGVSETIRRSDAANMAPLPGSLMPPGLLDALTAQQVADLLAFLKGQ